LSTLVWTRALAEWTNDQPLVEAALPVDVRLVRLPCLAIRPVPLKATRERYDFVVFTSTNAAQQALADPAFLAQVKSARGTYTHGAATDAALRQHGLAPTLVRDVRTAAELGDWLTAKLPAGASVAVPSAADPAFDLAGRLARAGYGAEKVVCYQTAQSALDETGKPLSSEAKRRLGRELVGVVCFASPSAVRGFANGLSPRTTRLTRSLVAVAIGPTTAKVAAVEFEKVETAAENSIRALLAKTVEILAKPTEGRR